MKKTLNPSTLVVLLFVFLYSCSSSDDDSNVNDNTKIDNSNFLEKFDGYGYFKKYSRNVLQHIIKCLIINKF